MLVYQQPTMFPLLVGSQIIISIELTKTYVSVIKTLAGLSSLISSCKSFFVN